MGKKISVIASTILWILGFALAFVIPAHSRYIFVPDALLLLGFWPLLYLWKQGWLWLMFGVLNVLIGFFLELMNHLDTSLFTHDMELVRRHLTQQHSSLTWILIGIVSTLIGLVKTLCQLWALFKKLINKNKQEKESSQV